MGQVQSERNHYGNLLGDSALMTAATHRVSPAHQQREMKRLNLILTGLIRQMQDLNASIAKKDASQKLRAHQLQAIAKLLQVRPLWEDDPDPSNSEVRWGLKTANGEINELERKALAVIHDLQTA